MAQPVVPTFTALSNPRTLWPNVAAANAFFQSFTFNITSANLPEATSANIGAVKQLEIGDFVAGAEVEGSYNMVSDDGVTQNEVPSIAAYNSLVTRVATLEAYLTQLMAQMEAKGYVA